MYLYLPLPRPTHDTHEPDNEPNAIPPSSIPRIPSSSIKLPAVPTLHFSPPEDSIPATIPQPKSATALQPSDSFIANTPYHRPSQHSRLAPDNNVEDELSPPNDSPALPPLSKEPSHANSPLKRPLGPSRIPSFETPQTPSRKAQPRRWAAPTRGSVPANINDPFCFT
jgi:hypothetical protein